MNESGNIKNPDFLFPRQSPDSIGMIYIDALKKVQHKLDEKEKSDNEKQLEIEKLKSICTLQNKQIDQLIHDNNELTNSCEREKSLRIKFEQQALQQQQQIQQMQQQMLQLLQLLQPQRTPIVQNDILADSDGTTKPRPPIRKRKVQPINTDTVDRLKKDRRHYAVACDAALSYWQKLADNELVDQNLRATPRCGVTVAARIVCCFQNVVDPDIRWSFFEKHWGMKHLQSNLNRSTYRDEKKYVLVNRIFGRSDDAPFIPKSQLTDL